MLLHQRFQLTKNLAQGGFGKTFLAEDTHMPSHRQCVVKLLQPASPRPEFYALALEYFQKEAAILEQLHHEQIPQLYAYFEEEGQFYLVQEWIEGKTLSQLILETKPLPEGEVRQILGQILRVLTYLHEKNVIHRDIKPDNIILRHSDQQPVLIDFGSVKQNLKTVISESGGVTCSVVLGSGGYMPPEQVVQRLIYSSDLYSLGMTAIFLLTGKKPFEIEKDQQSSHLLWHPYAPDVSAEFKAILDKVTQFNPKDRFRSASEMLQVLQQNSHVSLDNVSAVSSTPITSQFEPMLMADKSRENKSQMVTPRTAVLGMPFQRIWTDPRAKLAVGLFAVFAIIAFVPPVVENYWVQSEKDKQLSENTDMRRNQSIISAAEQMNADGDTRGAIAKVMEVSPTPLALADAGQKAAVWSEVKLGENLDVRLPARSLKRGMNALGTPLDTKFGRSFIDNQSDTWQDYEKPSPEEKASNASWDDPWKETYEIIPGKIEMTLIYGCQSKTVLQTQVMFDHSIPKEVMSAKLRQMLQGSSVQHIELVQASFNKFFESSPSPSLRVQLTTDQHKSWIMKDDESKIMIAVRNA